MHLLIILNFASPALRTTGQFRDVTQASHILPFLLNTFNEQSAEAVSSYIQYYRREIINLAHAENKQRLWTALAAFCGSNAIEPLKGSGINMLQNIMTLTTLYVEHPRFLLCAV
jgi:hypothetical protein